MVLAMTSPRSRWDRWINLASLAVVALGFLWIAVPSSVFLQPEAVIYDARRVTVKRLTPFGSVTAEWSREMYVVGTHLECHAPTRIEYVQKVNGYVSPTTGAVIAADTVSWREGEWALDCLQATPPIIVTNTWRVLFLGVIPLRPVRHVVTIENSLTPGDNG